MNPSFPSRKPLRIPNYDYSQCNIYFLTLCTKNRQPLFWSAGRLSNIGKLAEAELKRFSFIYENVRIEKYCIMPDHIHLLLWLDVPADGRPQVSPTVSRIIQQFKGTITKKIGQSIWQKSYYDHIIRNAADYRACWEYIENNPLKYEVKSCL